MKISDNTLLEANLDSVFTRHHSHWYRQLSHGNKHCAQSAYISKPSADQNSKDVQGRISQSLEYRTIK
jgi:hypothetical protein